MWSNRLDRLPRQALPDGLTVFEARDRRSRLLGLALLGDLPFDQALLFARCRSVHTLGMRLPIDIVFLDRTGAAVRVVTAARPGRAFGSRAARAILETGVGQAGRFIDAGVGGLVRR